MTKEEKTHCWNTMISNAMSLTFLDRYQFQNVYDKSIDAIAINNQHKNDPLAKLLQQHSCSQDEWWVSQWPGQAFMRNDEDLSICLI